MSPKNLPTVGEWFTSNILFLLSMIFVWTILIFVVWTFLDKEKKASTKRKFFTSLIIGFFLTVLFFVYKVVMIGLERLGS